MNAVGDMSVTFHRAFDMCRNPQEALEQIIELGCHRILTSGQEATAEKGIPLLKELVELADERIIIMPGCGVNPKIFVKLPRKPVPASFISLDAPPVKAICYTATPKYQWVAL